MNWLTCVLIGITACGGGTSRPSPAVGNTTTAAPGESVAVAVLFNAEEVWVGNEEHERDPVAQYPGALNSLRRAFELHPPARTLPPGSHGTLISYASAIDVRVPMGPIERLEPAGFGTQSEYRTIVGKEVATGVELAIEALSKATPARRALIVIGDGNDSNNEAATAQLAALKSRAAEQNIEVFAIVFKGQLSDPATVIGALSANVTTVATVDEMPAAIGAIFARLATQP